MREELERQLAIEDTQELFVCQDCIGDSILKQKASKTNLCRERTCACCGQTVRHALTPKYIAGQLKDVLPKFYELDVGLYPGYELSLKTIIGQAILCENDAIQSSIARYLIVEDAHDEDFYWEGQEYKHKSSPFDSEEHQRWYVGSRWEQIAHDLTHGQRYFNNHAKALFEDLITEALSAQSQDGLQNCPVIKYLPEGASLFRARLVNSRDLIKSIQQDPLNQLGAPPKNLAANNRMSPAGIPLLYLAAEPKTAIAEVRPSIGDQIAVGEFVTIAQLKLFDFTALDRGLTHNQISIFSSDCEERINRRLFLNYLHDEIAKPVRSTDTDYVMTQALAEYIRCCDTSDFDGIVFKSVQQEGGVNYVLFDKNLNNNTRYSEFGRPYYPLEISAENIKICTINSVRYEFVVRSSSEPPALSD